MNQPFSLSVILFDKTRVSATGKTYVDRDHVPDCVKDSGIDLDQMNLRQLAHVWIKMRRQEWTWKLEAQQKGQKFPLRNYRVSLFDASYPGGGKYVANEEYLGALRDFLEARNAIKPRPVRKDPATVEGLDEHDDELTPLPEPDPILGDPAADRANPDQADRGLANAAVDAWLAGQKARQDKKFLGSTVPAEPAGANQDSRDPF